ncbi:MAG: hypothetical protein Q9220_004764 [cf. Caloplaca sp. 1 TL-2023]
MAPQPIRTDAQEPQRLKKKKKDNNLPHLDDEKPVLDAPPKQLLTLIGAFLTSHGFHKTFHLYHFECLDRYKRHGWDSTIAEPLPEDFPNLVKIYDDWCKAYEEQKQLDETRSRGIDDKASDKRRQTVAAGNASAKPIEGTDVVKAEHTSSSGSSDDSSESTDSDTDMKDVVPLPKSKKKKSLSPLTSSSSSESEADDEMNTAGLGAPSRKSALDSQINNLKRKKSPSLSSSSDSSSSEGERAPKRAKKAGTESKIATKYTESSKEKTINQSKTTKKSSSKSSTSSSAASSSSASSSESEASIKPISGVKTAIKKSALSSSSETTSSSSSDSDTNEFAVPKLKPKQPPLDSKISSDSSVTLVPPTPRTAKKQPAASDPDSDTSTPTSTNSSSSDKKTTAIAITPSAPKSKPIGPTSRFTRVPTTTTVPPAFASNAYRPYDYADRAHQDLSVTKGKGFTKEKNKKKRGSYRGGVIDTQGGGGRGIKFED